MKSIYAVVITPPENGEKYFNVYVPDLDLYTQGTSVEDAIYMAKDCIGLWGISEEDAKREVPKGTTLKPEAGSDDIVTLVEVDFEAYREKEENKMVRKNCTIPLWLNREAEKKHINFSAVLQDALKSMLN